MPEHVGRRRKQCQKGSACPAIRTPTAIHEFQCMLHVHCLQYIALSQWVSLCLHCTNHAMHAPPRSQGLFLASPQFASQSEQMSITKCAGEKKSGERCTYNAQPGMRFCGVHAGQETKAGVKRWGLLSMAHTAACFQLRASVRSITSHMLPHICSACSTSAGGGTCQGFKKDNTPCTYQAQPGARYCGIHADQQAATASKVTVGR
jgi:hypothetical protein